MSCWWPYDVLLDYLAPIANCLPLASYLGGSPTLTINNSEYRVLGNLGEGAFSHVYLCENKATGVQVAVKKILCFHGTDALSMARREIAGYRTFRGIAGIVGLLDWCIQEEAAGDRRLVYMCFPVFKRGSLLEYMERGERRNEDWVVGVFLKLCRCVGALHGFDGPLVNDGLEGVVRRQGARSAAAGGYVPVDGRADDAVELSGDLGLLGSSAGGYVHRDIKPGNVMLADDDETPVLIDLGSIAGSRYQADTRADALRIQEDAAENCSMAYRAPELFDVQRGSAFDERTDVWSLGCLLFAMAYGYSPFEDPEEGPGASIALAAINARYRFPEPNPYSHKLVRLIEFMLEPDPRQRPFVDQVVALAESLYGG